MSAFAEELLSRFRWINGHADILGLLAEAGFLERSAAALSAPFEDAGVTRVTGIEARGFVFGAAVAARLGAGFVPVRSPAPSTLARKPFTFLSRTGEDGASRTSSSALLSPTETGSSWWTTGPRPAARPLPRER